MHTRKLHHFVVAALIALLPLSAIARQSSSENVDQTAIAETLSHYEQALNASDTDAVMKLYASDAVFMPQYSPPSVGRDAIRTAYRHVFDTIQLNIAFTVDEIHVLAPDWAYARTRSSGSVRVLASGRAPGPEANQEIFVLHREPDGQWRFARYIFSSTNPPKEP